VSADNTHHELDGAPLYAARFDEALSFHEPGLAAVRGGAPTFSVSLGRTTAGWEIHT
jgi:hypothetical protein